MRRLVAAALAAVLALTLAACGGGEEQPAAPSTTTANSAPPPIASGKAVAPVVDRSPTETVSFEPFPTGGSVTTITPVAIAENLEAGQAMVLFYFDSTQTDSDDIRGEIDKVLSAYRGLVELVAFDMRKASPGALQKVDPELEKASMIADRVGISGTPYVMVIDTQGLITWRIKGPVDADILEREVIRATQ